jgi:hypothetical protein
MEKENSITVQVRIPKETSANISKLSKKFDLYGYEVVDFAIKYFVKTGYNPSEMTTIETPAEEMKKLRNSIVSFYKKHESEFLTPLINRLDSATMTLVEFLKDRKGAQPLKSTETKSTPSTIAKSVGLFALPDSALEEDSEMINLSNNNNEMLNATIALEKKDNEIKFLRVAIADTVKKFDRKGDNFQLTLTKIEFEEFSKLSNVR